MTSHQSHQEQLNGSKLFIVNEKQKLRNRGENLIRKNFLHEMQKKRNFKISN